MAFWEWLSLNLSRNVRRKKYTGMGMDPYISFVVVARNDNYGGDFLYRINIFVKVLLTLCEKYELPSELIIVEWNPPDDRPKLKDAISWPDIQRKHCQVRIIEVPNEVHNKLPNPAKMPLFEYMGKNVGIRRAMGEFILATNPDVIFSKELIQFLSQKNLSKNSFYRIDRYDVKSTISLSESVEKILEHCSNNIIRVCSYFGTYEPNKRLDIYRQLRRYAGYIKRRILLFPYTLPHTNASGDFFLLHRSQWFNLRGYPELETKGKSHYIDGIVAYQSVFAGLKQEILKKMQLYHIDHERIDPNKPGSEAVQSAYKRILEEKKVILFNDENWGLKNILLKEEVVS